MCDLSRKLVAWMDGELPENEAATVAQHVAFCGDCRECLAAIDQASKAFNAYCNAAVAQSESFAPAETSAGERRAFHWAPVAFGIGAIAAAAVLAMLVMPPRQHVATVLPVAPADSPPAHVVEPSSSVAAIVAARPIARQHHDRSQLRIQKTSTAHGADRQNPRVAQPQATSAISMQPPIEISVPVEDMFPPGAVPDGISYSAVVTFTADSSAPRNGNANLNGIKAAFNSGGNRP